MSTLIEIPTYCLTTEVLWWLARKCEENINLFRLEQDFEGCQWIPVDYLKDLLTESTLNLLLEEVEGFDLTTE